MLNEKSHFQMSRDVRSRTTKTGEKDKRSQHAASATGPLRSSWPMLLEPRCTVSSCCGLWHCPLSERASLTSSVPLDLPVKRRACWMTKDQMSPKNSVWIPPSACMCLEEVVVSRTDFGPK